MSEITGLVIARDEARDLPGCLEVMTEICDSLIVVDNESIDETPDIAKRFGAKVLGLTMDQATGFAGLRNRGLAQVETAYTLLMDADERPDCELIDSIKTNVKLQDSGVAYQFSRRNNAFGGWLNHGRFSDDKQIRIIPSDTRYDGNVHEMPVLAPDTKIIELDGELRHYTYRNLAEYLSKLNDYAQKIALTESGIPYSSSAVQTLLDNLIAQQGYRDGWRGFVMAAGDGYHEYLVKKYIKQIRSSQI